MVGIDVSCKFVRCAVPLAATRIALPSQSPRGLPLSGKRENTSEPSRVKRLSFPRLSREKTRPGAAPPPNNQEANRQVRRTDWAEPSGVRASPALSWVVAPALALAAADLARPVGNGRNCRTSRCPHRVTKRRARPSPTSSDIRNRHRDARGPPLSCRARADGRNGPIWVPESVCGGRPWLGDSPTRPPLLPSPTPAVPTIAR